MRFWDSRNFGEKDPTAILEFEFDCNDWIKQTGDYYLRHEFSTTGNIKIHAHREENGVIFVTIGGGEIGTTCRLTLQIFTENGMTDSRSFHLRIKQQ